MGDDGGKGSGRKPGNSKNRADDALMARLRAAAKRAKADPPPASVAENARSAFKNQGKK